MGASLSPKLKELLGSLGSTVKEEELLKKVGDLVESKLAAAFAKVGSVAPSQPPPTKQTTVKSANPVPLQPTRAKPPPPKSKPAPKSSATRHHPARLILQVTSCDPKLAKLTVADARDSVNLALQKLGTDAQVVGIS